MATWEKFVLVGLCIMSALVTGYILGSRESEELQRVQRTLAEQQEMLTRLQADLARRPPASSVASSAQHGGGGDAPAQNECDRQADAECDHAPHRRVEPVAPPERELSDEQLDDAADAYDDAREIVENALARKSWTQDDVDNFRHLRQFMLPGQLDSLMRQVVVAVNKQELKLDTAGPPF